MEVGFRGCRFDLTAHRSPLPAPRSPLHDKRSPLPAPRQTLPAPRPSELDLRAELHHSIRGNTEELRRRPGVARHHDEKSLPPSCETQRPRRGVGCRRATDAGTRRGFAPLQLPVSDDDPLASKVERRVHRSSTQSMRAGDGQDLRHVGRLHEAVARRHAVEALLQALDGDPLLVRDLGNLLRQDRHQHDLLVQHLVVLEVMEQHHRYPLRR